MLGSFCAARLIRALGAYLLKLEKYVMKSIFGLLLLLTCSTVITQAQQSAENRQPKTQLSVAENKKVCVLGDVLRPALIPFRSGLSVAKAIEDVGGVPKDTNSNEVRVYSQTIEGEMRVIRLDLKAIKKRPYLDLVLQSYDIVEVVPRNMKKRTPQSYINPCFSGRLKTID
jgi:hypothetical protein